MKIYSRSVGVTVLSTIIISATAQQNQKYVYTEDEVKEVYLKNAYISGCSKRGCTYRSVRGYVPTYVPEGDTLPLYIRLSGTFDKFAWSTDVQIQTKDMAMRGLAAFSVDYDNTVYPFRW